MVGDQVCHRAGRPRHYDSTAARFCEGQEGSGDTGERPKTLNPSPLLFGHNLCVFDLRIPSLFLSAISQGRSSRMDIL